MGINLLATLEEASCSCHVITICVRIYRHGTSTSTVSTEQEVVITAKLKGNALEISWLVVTISSLGGLHWNGLNLALWP